jgi:hypothetical protein
MKISDALVGVSSLFLDTAPVIYFVERNPQFVDLARSAEAPHSLLGVWDECAGVGRDSD